MTKAVDRIPRITVRSRSGVRILRHGMRLGWRVEYPEQFPVTVTRFTPTRTRYRRAA